MNDTTSNAPDEPSTVSRPSFLMMTCQVGAEQVLKNEILSRYPEFRFSYSRPGFLTWKVPESVVAKPQINIDSVLARYCGIFLGKVQGDNLADRSEIFWNLIGNRRFDRLHVFSKDQNMPGEHGYEPGLTQDDALVHHQLMKDAPDFLQKEVCRYPFLEAKKGNRILDCLQVTPNEWWVGFHKVFDWRSSLPGGLLPVRMPRDAVSRAFLKFEEGLRWSGIPIETGTQCLDIGSSPGGGTQALLARGAKVIGVDPAEMASLITKHPNFSHLRGRINQVKRKYLAKTRWIITDINVSPNYTLDVLEELVTHPKLRIRGLLFTLKLLDWNFFADIPDYTKRIRSWGVRNIDIKQLQFNRQEVMVSCQK